MKELSVAIAIVLREGEILIRQRRRDVALAGLWEFPGGKQEPGESLEQCVLRELVEETAIQARIIESLPSISFSYPAGDVRIHPYLCQHLSGEAQPLGCQRTLWVKPAELPDYEFPPANDDLIYGLVRRFASAH